MVEQRGKPASVASQQSTHWSPAHSSRPNLFSLAAMHGKLAVGTAAANGASDLRLSDVG